MRGEEVDQFEYTYPVLHQEIRKINKEGLWVFDWHTNGKGELIDVCIEDRFNGLHLIITVSLYASADYLAGIEIHGEGAEKYEETMQHKTAHGQTRQEAITKLIAQYSTIKWTLEL